MNGFSLRSQGMYNAAILDYSFSSFWPQPMRNFESSSMRSAMLRLKNMAFLKKVIFVKKLIC